MASSGKRLPRKTPPAVAANLPAPATPPITLANQHIVSDLLKHGLTPAEVSASTGIGPPDVARAAVSGRDTREAAKETLQAGANDLASRVVTKANVAECIDVLERVGVLEPKRDSARGGSVNILIGMPGAPIGPDLSPLVFDLPPALPETTTTKEQHLTAEIARLNAELAKARRQ
jgi:hypothetical protein